MKMMIYLAGNMVKFSSVPKYSSGTPPFSRAINWDYTGKKLKTSLFWKIMHIKPKS